MFKKTILMSVLTLILGLTQLQAQDTLKILDASILLELDTVQLYVSPSNINPNNLDSLGFCVKVLAAFSDTSNIDSIHIKVGRTIGGSDVAHLSFAYNSGNPSSVLTNFLANETGFCVCVAPSAYNAYTLYLELWAEDKTGYTTPVYSTQVN